MKNMKVILNYDEYFHRSYYVYFEIVEEVPKVGTQFGFETMEEDGHFSVVDKVEELTVDIYNHKEVFDYDLYKIVVRHYHYYGDEVEANNECHYYAVKKKN